MTWTATNTRDLAPVSRGCATHSLPSRGRDFICDKKFLHAATKITTKRKPSRRREFLTDWASLASSFILCHLWHTKSSSDSHGPVGSRTPIFRLDEAKDAPCQAHGKQNSTNRKLPFWGVRIVTPELARRTRLLNVSVADIRKLSMGQLGIFRGHIGD